MPLQLEQPLEAVVNGTGCRLQIVVRITTSNADHQGVVLHLQRATKEIGLSGLLHEGFDDIISEQIRFQVSLLKGVGA